MLLIDWNTAATTFTVNSDGKADYKSIQKAIDSASNGDKILVYPGVYTENVNVKKGLEIKSISGIPEYTIIEASNPNNDVVKVTANSATINGFVVTGVNSPHAGLFFDRCHNSTSIGNKLLRNHQGILLELASRNKVLNTIANNNGDGIVLFNSADNIIANNTVNSNGFSGIMLTNSSKNILKNYTATQNKMVGIDLGKSTTLFLIII